MKALKLLLSEIVGLFIDDTLLALGIAVVVGAAAILAGVSAGWAGATLILGSLAILVASVWRSLAPRGS